MLSQTFNSETTKLLGSTKSEITKFENGENLPYLEISELLLIQFNVVNNNYQQNSKILYTFVHNKSFGELLNISSKNKKIFFKNFWLRIFIYWKVVYRSKF